MNKEASQEVATGNQLCLLTMEKYPFWDIAGWRAHFIQCTVLINSAKYNGQIRGYLIISRWIFALVSVRRRPLNAWCSVRILLNCGRNFESSAVYQIHIQFSSRILYFVGIQQRQIAFMITSVIQILFNLTNKNHSICPKNKNDLTELLAGRILDTQ